MRDIFINDSGFRGELRKTDSGLALALASMPDWADREISLACLLGGLSNQVYRVEIDGQFYVARVPGRTSELLGGNREAEIYNTSIAGTNGIAPKVLKVLQDSGGLILEFVEGIPLTPQLLADERVVSSVISTLKALHGGPEFCNRFSIYDLIKDFDKRILEPESVGLQDYAIRYPIFDRMQSILDSSCVAMVPCHNDAFPKNWIVDRAQRALLIDFEYSGNNDPAFDLATLYVEAGWTQEQAQTACSLYYCSSDPHNFSRVWLQSILFDIGWSLYAAVQSNVSSQGSRFKEIATKRWQRACAKIDSLDFESRLMSLC